MVQMQKIRPILMRTCFMDKLLFIAAPLLLMLMGCASLSATNSNLRQIDAMIEKPQPKKQETKAKPLKDPLPDGPIPLEVFAGGSIITAPDYSNRWYPRLIEWSHLYRTLTENEIDMRNFKLSEKYSKEALVWAKRAKIIQTMTGEKAFVVVEPWIAGFKTPQVQPASRYFLGKQVYGDALKAKAILDELKDRVCLIDHGYPLVSVYAQFENSVDLMNQKYFNRAAQRIQSVLSMLDSTDSPKKVCMEESEE